MAKAKGFYPKPKATATLKFTDGDYEGAEVVCSLAGTMGLWENLVTARGTTAQAASFRQFGDMVLQEWNVLDKKGEDVPADGVGMLAVDTDFAQAVISAWIDAATGVADPLDAASSSGSTSS